jgi:hypothetical protein
MSRRYLSCYERAAQRAPPMRAARRQAGRSIGWDENGIRGNPEFRALLVVAATADLRVARNDARTRPRLKALLARRHLKVVAQANKTARII